MAKITIPYAVADFIEMRERGFYYVDKTDYISKLEEYKAPVFFLSPPFWQEFVGFYFSLLL